VSDDAEARAVPPPPEKPLPNDCCAGGCTPCVWDTYEQALADWQARYGERAAA
jgi:hypothetical protein